MCVILERKPGQVIHPDVIAACYETNPAGFGVAWYDGSKVRITKGVKSLDAIQAIVKGLQNYLSLIHFRWATIGDKVKENCHPFAVGVNQAAMVHNGSFPTKPRKTKTKSGYELQWSDTKEIGHILNSWSEEIIRRSLGKFKEWHGEGNRTAILMSNGDILKTGSWSNHDGLTCSNLNWKVRNYRKNQTTGYSVNGTYYQRNDADDLKYSDYGIVNRNHSNSACGHVGRYQGSDLKVANENPNEFIKYGKVWMSRRDAAQKELEKKTNNNQLNMSLSATSVGNQTQENHPTTGCVQHVNSDTAETQANGLNGRMTNKLNNLSDEVIKKVLLGDHFKVIINVHTKKTPLENNGKQRYFIYYWDFDKHSVRSEYCDDDLETEIDTWKKTGMTIHVTEIFDGRGKQRIITPGRVNSNEA